MDPSRPLSPQQHAALEQLSAITARSADPASPEGRTSVELLERSGWNVETAISRIFDDGPIASTSTSSSARHAYPPAADDNTGVDATLLPSANATRRRTANNTGGLGTGAVGLYYLRQALAVPISILSIPASILYNLGALLLGLIARLLRLRGPSTVSLRPRNPFAPGGALGGGSRTILSPAAAAEQWIRSVEEVTGLPRRDERGSAHGASYSAARAGPSSSGLSARRTSAPAPPGTGKRLPRFHVGSYESALRLARDELRILMVVLTSEENERDERFKREVLCDEEVNRAIEEGDVLVWGGDVSERDAYQAGQTLAYVALPFIAFIASQPSTVPPGASVNPATASTASPRLRLLSRLEPAPSAPLTAASLHAHLQTAVFPRARPYLARLAQQQQQREADRAARDEAERRVAENARRDEERVLAVRRRAQEQERAEAARRDKEAREERERRDRERIAARARAWRVRRREELARRPEGEDVRVAVRLGNGKRVVRGFGAAEGTEAVYAWVECELGQEDDARSGSGVEVDLPEGYEQHFHFRLATTFPRQVIPLPSHLASPSTADVAAAAPESVTVGKAFEGLGKLVNLVVDGLEERRRMSMSSREEADSEEEEEED
ncbi:clathrin-mediated endocytosis regulator UBX3 [Rhodotorula paludigena]|uniref:clathrin-mediated endocytosis regulator UBX3 n=1 Tax=Rhodotorula paludigena TaxID=86838 RepID=UPI00317DBD88